MSSLNTDVEEFSVGDAMENVLCYKGIWFDNDFQGFVINVPQPTRLRFAMLEAHIFKALWKKKKRLYLVVEQKNTDKPEVVQVRAIDGNMVFLKGRMGFTPEPGACVSLFLGYKTQLVNEELLYEWEKQKKTGKLFE